MTSSDFLPIDLTGIPAPASAIILAIDADCRVMAAKRLLDGPTAEELRAATVSQTATGAGPWLIDALLNEAKQLDTDARLVAVMSLKCHARSLGQTVYFHEIYADLVREAVGAPTSIDPKILHRVDTPILQTVDRAVALRIVGSDAA